MAKDFTGRVDCPTCKAPAGKNCVSVKNGNWMLRSHRDRVDAAYAAWAAKPRPKR